MGRTKGDGLGKTGGRQKGTPNRRVTVQEWINEVIQKRRKQFENDLDTLTPSERAQVLATLAASVAAPNKPTEPTPGAAEDLNPFGTPIPGIGAVL